MEGLPSCPYANCDVPAAILGHVDDGNYHVVLAIDPSGGNRPVAAINKKMVQYAISVGGTSTGEHGVGADKIAYRRRSHGRHQECHRSRQHHESGRGSSRLRFQQRLIPRKPNSVAVGLVLKGFEPTTRRLIVRHDRINY
ncbi:FAD-binding oxidoreductase [Agrobacterium tumefaciens]|uniref:FAD-binding oxidoreductase n=1 Tax=Agrobacterium tumefaciens TaxID=358 RepID=UPI0039778ACF